jgi:hypothetical protein
MHHRRFVIRLALIVAVLASSCATASVASAALPSRDEGTCTVLPGAGTTAPNPPIPFLGTPAAPANTYVVPDLTLECAFSDATDQNESDVAELHVGLAGSYINLVCGTGNADGVGQVNAVIGTVNNANDNAELKGAHFDYTIQFAAGAGALVITGGDFPATSDNYGSVPDGGGAVTITATGPGLPNPLPNPGYCTQNFQLAGTVHIDAPENGE